MTIATDEKELSVILHGREQLWAVRAKVRVPKETITGMRFEKSFKDWRKWEVRMPGASAPKLLIAGSFWTEEGWDFMYVRKPRGFYKPTAENVLVIETDQNRYCRIIVSCEEDEAKKIISWWQKKPKKVKG